MDYCLKCKKKTEDVGPHMVQMKNGKMARESRCKTCGTTKFAFVSDTRQAGGNPLAVAGVVAEALPGVIGGISDAVDKGKRTDRELAREDGQLNVDRDKKFQQFYRDLMHQRYWDPEKLRPSLRFPREKTNNPKYKAEQDANTLRKNFMPEVT